MPAYADPAYTQSLSAFGTPLELPCSGGWVLVREIPGTSRHDAMGPYPLFACQDWSRLHVDLEGMEPEVVSVVLVTDPFGAFNPAHLKDLFPDLFVPYKDHHILTMEEGSNALDAISSHHRRNALKALGNVRPEICDNPLDHVDEWDRLYGELARLRAISGIRRFSRESFVQQLSMPGLVMLRATHHADTVGMMLWYEAGDVAYYHLGASTEKGYELRASFALSLAAIEHFEKRGLRCLDFGAGAGAYNNASDGLTRFKRGWGNSTRRTYLCGRIIDRAAYKQMTVDMSHHLADYFPAYRRGEFE